MDVIKCPNDHGPLYAVHDNKVKCSVCDFTYEILQPENPYNENYHEIAFKSSYRWEGQI